MLVPVPDQAMIVLAPEVGQSSPLGPLEQWALAEPSKKLLVPQAATAVCCDGRDLVVNARVDPEDQRAVMLAVK